MDFVFYVSLSQSPAFKDAGAKAHSHALTDTSQVVWSYVFPVELKCEVK